MNHVKKNQSISFQLDVADLQSKGLLTIYKRLQKNRILTRFCREAFIEKAHRHLNGLDPHHAHLNDLIKSKGIEYVLEAVQEKEAHVSSADEIAIQKAADKIILALMNVFQKESSPPIAAADENKDATQNKPDIEKLKALL